ncbi:NAD-dependent epimerase/dehydratase family protein [Catellatospora coxensis]|uniref:Putative UDP-glucose epimerase YtcB n=1 Tax=Catellatospora coxensis TaxID=310354 RepID=A0A8J3KP38_9ACTN|nr:NAD-dependent epimerase/dehydratase family protein [Catellatospora coxensis]GIG03673.1 putative UDP-glucose epimerase YtcB [Catellatospora coxensis]
MKRVLVTGASGFIGSHLVSALVSDGVQVVGLDYAPPRFEDTVGELMGSPLFMPVHLDLTSDSLDAVVAGCDTVFHLAAKPGVRGSWGDDFGNYVTANVLGTHRLLEACWRARTSRVVYASSSSVYGAVRAPSGEDDDCRPMSPYGVTKLAGEQLCLAYARRHDNPLSVVALRYFTVYGPRQRPDMAFGRLLLAAYTGLPLTLYGDGTQRRDFTYVSDVVAATMAAAKIDAQEEIINVGGGASVSMIEAIDIASEVAGRPVPLTAVAAQPGDVPATRADLSLARELLGYQPAVDIREGLARQAEWLRGLPAELVSTFTTELSGSAR